MSDDGRSQTGMSQKVTVGEDTVRLWVRKAMDEAGTIPQGGPPVTPKRRPVVEADDDDDNIKKRKVHKLPPYRGDLENRPGPGKSTKSTADEKGGGKADDLARIAFATGHGQPDVPEVDIGGKRFSPDEESTYIPPGSSLGTSAARLEKEKAIDRLELAMGKKGAREQTMVPDLVLQMLEYAVMEYRRLLEDPAKIIKYALRDYIIDAKEQATLPEPPEDEVGEIERSLGQDLGGPKGPWSPEEHKQITSDKGLAYLAMSPSFQRYWKTWKRAIGGNVDVKGEKHKGAMQAIEKMMDRMPGGGRDLWFRSVFNIANWLGTLDVNNQAPARLPEGEKSFAELLGLETAYEPDLTQVDLALILKDAGFRYYVAGGGGKRVYYLDWVRNEAQRLGRYRGQF